MNPPPAPNPSGMLAAGAPNGMAGCCCCRCWGRPNPGAVSGWTGWPNSVAGAAWGLACAGCPNKVAGAAGGTGCASCPNSMAGAAAGGGAAGWPNNRPVPGAAKGCPKGAAGCPKAAAVAPKPPPRAPACPECWAPGPKAGAGFAACPPMPNSMDGPAPAPKGTAWGAGCCGCCCPKGGLWGAAAWLPKGEAERPVRWSSHGLGSWMGMPPKDGLGRACMRAQRPGNVKGRYGSVAPWRGRHGCSRALSAHTS